MPAQAQRLHECWTLAPTPWILILALRLPSRGLGQVTHLLWSSFPHL